MRLRTLLLIASRAVLAASLASLAIGGCTEMGTEQVSSTGGKVPAPYPASFAGAVINGCTDGRFAAATCSGLKVFSSRSGQVIRNLTRDDPFSPEVLSSARAVYYFRPGKGNDCANLLRVPYGGGRATVVRRFVNEALGTYAISGDGTMLAYQHYPQKNAVPRFPCGETDVSLLTVVNLATGARHTTPAPAIFDMAWSPDDKHLAIEFPVTPTANSAVQVLAQPFSIPRSRPGTLLPCPDRARTCLQFSPRYDQAGHIFYIAGLPAAGSGDRQQDPPCGLSCRYILTEVTGTRVADLASIVGLNRSQDSAWCAVNPSGTAAVFTVPRGRGFATFRWSGGRITRLKYPVTGVSW
jgi:hypothetical protein